MQHVFDWSKGRVNSGKTWLILGKGPTFSLRERFDLEQFNTVALNHAVRLQSVDIAHAVDIDVVDDCADCLVQNAEWLLMPLYPHVHCKPSGLPLQEFVSSLPVLQAFDEAGRLLWYDLWSGQNTHRRPMIHGTFSASVVVNLLAQLGVRKVRTLGVDGGTNYDSSFSNRTLFLNGHSSFDVQFSEIRETSQAYRMTVEKLAEPIRIFVGCDDSQLVAGKVLEYSIKKYTAHPVEVFFMNDMPVPPPKHKKNRPGTGFSFNRFLIPRLAGYRGKAIYIDADMLVFDDIEKLWNIPMEGKKVLCSTQTDTPNGWKDGKNNDHGPGRYWTPGRQMSVMLLDCDRLDWDVEEIVRGLDEDQYSYKELMAQFCIMDESEVADTIPSTWNCLEWFEHGKSQLVHFTIVPTQPWKNEKNALNDMWTDAFREAVAAGAVPLDLIRTSVERELIKSSLLDIAVKIVNRAETSGSRYQSAAEMISEATRLRRMLWDTMISNYTNQSEARRMSSSVGWNIENYLFRIPFHFTMRVSRFGARKIKRLINRSAQ